MTRKGNTPQYLSPEYEMIRDAAQELGLSHAIALKMHRMGVLQTALTRYGCDSLFTLDRYVRFNEKAEIPSSWRTENGIGTIDTMPTNGQTSKK